MQGEKKEDKARYTIYVKAGVMKEFRIACLRKDINVSLMIETLMAKMIKEGKKNER